MTKRDIIGMGQNGSQGYDDALYTRVGADEKRIIIPRLGWVMSMIQQSSVSNELTYDVAADYTEDQQELIAEFLETLIDFNPPSDDLTGTMCERCKVQFCKNGKCNYDDYVDNK